MGRTRSKIGASFCPHASTSGGDLESGNDKDEVANFRYFPEYQGVIGHMGRRHVLLDPFGKSPFGMCSATGAACLHSSSHIDRALPLWLPCGHNNIECNAAAELLDLGAEFAMDGAWMGLNGGHDGKMKSTDGSVSFASSNGADYFVEFTFVPRPMEPNDVDKPVCCPPPEPCIVHDGILFKDRLAHSRRRGTDLLGSMRETDHIEYYSTPPSRRRINRSSQEVLQSPALIAPDLVATKIID